MSPETALTAAIRPALALLPAVMGDEEAQAMLVAIALQESGLRHRVQIGGPARGLWQFERIGVRGVREHHATSGYADGIAVDLLYPLDDGAIYDALRDADVLAAAYARLYLWQYPAALPSLDGGPEEPWRQYVETWRPGKPHPERWAENWAIAVGAVT